MWAVDGEMSDERVHRAWSGTKGDCLRCRKPENDPSRAECERAIWPGERRIWILLVTSGTTVTWNVFGVESDRRSSSGHSGGYGGG